jgi:hypothetical protein
MEVYQDPAGDRKIIIQWDNASELRKDPITGEDVFEGYRVWRADRWQRPEGSIGPSPGDWMKIAEFRLRPEAASEQGVRPLREALTIPRVPPIGETEDDPPKPIFPIGRYRYEDRKGIINGKLHFYAVTAFGVIRTIDPETGEYEEMELSGLPTAVEAEGVVPRWDAWKEGCDQVRVVPNPYRGGAAWDLIPSDRDPTGTKIAFRNLPQDTQPVRIKIHTLAGDVVQEATQYTGDGDGTWFWNLLSRNGQDVVSGIYLYSVHYTGGICRGRFVIIR